NAVGLKSVRISFRSPWQNGVAERWIGSCRRDLLDHVIPIGQRHLRRLLSEYVRYYQDDRTHLGLQKDTPAQRQVACRSVGARVISEPRIGGLHHRYDLAACKDTFPFKPNQQAFSVMEVFFSSSLASRHY